MSLPALEDIDVPIDGVTRIENAPREKATPIIMEMMRSGDEDHKAAVESMMQLSKEEQEKGYDEFRSKFDSLQGA